MQLFFTKRAKSRLGRYSFVRRNLGVRDINSKQLRLLYHRNLRRRLATHQLRRVRLKIRPGALKVLASKPFVVVGARDDDQRALFFSLVVEDYVRSTYVVELSLYFCPFTSGVR